ncbi:hypothetical protein POTOM_003224 [Populus tomentosa]|uniref:Uncharacterized protein n=1 Tax=Populus tomentosa TaxID=118781 RepID=A0A8X8IYQ1_POPTO|nr:hypothetical protein POTOM_003224 [Populus tomentosa]
MSLEAIELHLHLHLLFLPAFTEIYMTLLEGKIAESTLLGIPMGKYDGLTVKLWSSTLSVQVGSVGQIETEVENVSLVLDSAKENLIWCPYAIALESWDLFKFHGEKQMWATAGSSLNEDLMAFARRGRVSMLRAVDFCSEHYLPHTAFDCQAWRQYRQRENNSMDLQNVPPPVLRYLLGAD